MSYQKYRFELSRPDLDEKDIFGVLKNVSSLVNNKETSDLGRDLVIRCLARIDLFGEFEKTILISLVRIVGLYPYMTNFLDLADNLDILAYELHRPDNMTEVFHSLQSKVYHLLRSGANVVLSASTSSGKSLIVDAIIAIGQHKRIVLIVPTLALIDETRRRLTKRFGNNCRIVTHPSQDSDAKRTTIYILTQERALQRKDLQKIDFFVVDEFYKLDLAKDSDKKRAEDLNLAFHRLAATGAQFYMLGPNVQGVLGLRRYDIHFISTNYATVAADIFSFGLPKNGDDRPKKLIEICKKLSGPTIVYCQGVGTSSRVAQLLMREIPSEPTAECTETADWMAENLHPSWVASEALRKGVGVHHNGVPRALQQQMVRLFNERQIKFLVCTSTLIEGVNTVAENVVMYDRRRGNPKLDYFTYKNIHGRAGRMGQYFIGKIFVLEKPIDEAEVVVEYVLDAQTTDTPLSLLLMLDEDELTEVSRDRIEDAMQGVSLSMETIRANSYVKPLFQERAASELRETIISNAHLTAWNGMPSPVQLHFVCDLIIKHVSGPRYQSYGIIKPEHLVWYLRNYAHPDRLKHLLRQMASSPETRKSVAERIDDALKIFRNILCYQFPQDLMVISRIQSEIAGKLKKPLGNYIYYAELLQNLFMPPAVAALEEYGLPHQIARKLLPFFEADHDLDSVLDRLKTLPASAFSTLTEFEGKMVNSSATMS